MNRLVFFLAPDEEDIMMPLVPEYWKAHQQGEQALEAIHPRIWETWHAKFPIDFLALTGHYSTKEDDSDCRCRKLRCIERYLLRLGTITARYSVEDVRNAVIHLESQGDRFLLQPLSPEVATVLMPSLSPTVCLDSPLVPRHSPRILALKKAALTASVQGFSGPATSSSPPSPLCHKQQATLTKFDRTTHLKCPLSGTLTLLSYPVKDRRKIGTMQR
ncbi:uncharacterized protein ARMOST_10428 [Armillaria ostoyae]|uniref:Uncharacterized protein n=1 Tax=Armillaria ostoyae TaxID=47428 RepID=A0A284RED1_ARMOS|nr:uncharacterized protein ARMOST_10428 [Armillaria ostoyae]